MTEHSAHGGHAAASRPVLERHCDVVVIGGSPAGLAAARQLARRRPSTIVIDDGTEPGVPGGPVVHRHGHGSGGAEGGAPATPIEIGRAELRAHGGEVLRGRVLAVHSRDDGRFALDLTGGHTLTARRVLDATEPIDVQPVIDGLAEEDRRDPGRPTGDQTDWEGRYDGADHVWSGNPNGTLVHETSGLAPGRALDIGAGEGADALWLAQRGWTVTATDISANALARIRAEADRRGVELHLVRGDANDPAAFGSEPYDLVSLQYGAFKRTPDQRGVHNLLGAVALGGTLLVVHHDLAGRHQPADPATQTQMYDPLAFVGVDEIAEALAADSDRWRVEVHETRPRPPGAATGHDVDDVVLRAVSVRR